MEIFYAGSQIRAVQIRAMRNRASRGMTVVLFWRKQPPNCVEQGIRDNYKCLVYTVLYLTTRNFSAKPQILFTFPTTARITEAKVEKEV